MPCSRFATWRSGFVLRSRIESGWILAAVVIWVTAVFGLTPAAAAADGGVPGEPDAAFAAAFAADFPPQPAGAQSISALAFQPDGKLVVGGTTPILARLLPDGSADGEFGTNIAGLNLHGGVGTVAIQPDGRILIAHAMSGLIRLMPDGTRDTEFAANLGSFLMGQVRAILVQPDGKIVVGGDFSTQWGPVRLVRLASNGQPDLAFHQAKGNGPTSSVYVLAMDQEGGIIVGGNFLSINFAPPSGLIRLHPDGSVDADFRAAVGSSILTVSAVAVQPNGKILYVEAGQLRRLLPSYAMDTAFNSAVVTGSGGGIGSLALQADGRILVGGMFSSIGSRQARGFAAISEDGATVETFRPTMESLSISSIGAVAPAPDAGVVLSVVYSGSAPPGNSLVRLSNYDAADFLYVDGDRIRWRRGGSSPGGNVVSFAGSADGEVWQELGTGAWDGTGAWELVEDSSSLSWIRAKMRAPGGANGTSTGFFTRTISLTGTPQNIDFPEMEPVAPGDAFFPAATASSGLPVEFVSDDSSIAYVFDGKLRTQRAGTVAIHAYQKGNEAFNPAPVVSRVLEVGQLSQTIEFASVPDKEYGDEPFLLEVAATSGLPVTFVSSDPVIASIADGIVTIHRAGTVEITASQAGDHRYEAADPVVRLLTIHPAAQTIDFPVLFPVVAGAAPFPAGAVASSGLPVALTSSDPTVVSVVDGVITVHAAGTVILTASQAGDERYHPAEPVERELRVLAAAPVIAGPSTAWGQEGRLFEYAVAAPGAVHYTASGLPPGLTLDPSTGLIDGRPKLAGEYQMRIGAGNADGVFASKQVAVTIYPLDGPPPEITGAEPVRLAAGKPLPYVRIRMEPVHPGSEILLTNLPDGLVYDPATGILTGVIVDPGYYEVEIEASNLHGIRRETLVLAVAREEFETVVLPTEGILRGIAEGEGSWVVVGDQGLILYSLDGDEWEVLPPVTNGDLRGVAYGAGVFVAVGNGGVILRSTDGQTWEDVEAAPDRDLRKVQFLDGKFMAFSEAGPVLTSEAGTVWTEGEATSSGLIAAASGGGMTLGAAVRWAAVSPDGNAWTRTAVNLGYGKIGVAYGNGRFAVGHQNGWIGTTRDGDRWAVNPERIPQFPRDIGFMEDQFFVVSGGNLFSSPDGMLWDRLAGSDFYLNALNHGPTVAAVGEGGRLLRRIPGLSPTPEIVSSTTATHTRGEPIEYQISATHEPHRYYAFGLPEDLAVDSNSGRIHGSVEAPGTYRVLLGAENEAGVAPTRPWEITIFADEGMPPGLSQNYTVTDTVAPQMFVINRRDASSEVRISQNPPGLSFDLLTQVWRPESGVSGWGEMVLEASNHFGTAERVVRYVIPPPDGWENQESATAGKMTAIAFGNGRFIAGGEDGSLLASLDGINWTVVRAPDGFAWRGLAYGGNLWVAVGEGGRILVSEDGDVWNDRSSGVTADLRAVAYGSGRFVAVGKDGTVLTSLDGTAWTSGSPGTSADFRDVTHGGGTFLAVCDEGKAYVSVEGIEWDSQQVNEVGRLLSAVYHDGDYFVSGDPGLVCRSSDLESWMLVLSIGDTVQQVFAYGERLLAFGSKNFYSTPLGAIHAWERRVHPEMYGTTGMAYGNGRLVGLSSDGGVYSRSGEWLPMISSCGGNLIVGQPYFCPLKREAAPVEEFVVSGLPAGLTFDPVTGEISGVPEGIGTFAVEAFAVGSRGPGPIARWTMRVHPEHALDPPFLTERLAEGAVGVTVQYYPQVGHPWAGYRLPYTMVATGSAPGLAWHPIGFIQGTPSAPGLYPYEVEFHREDGVTSDVIEFWVHEPNWPRWWTHFPAVRSFAFGSGRLLGVGEGGQTVYRDLATGFWLTGSIGGGHSPYGVAFGANRFVTVGAGGAIRTSANGASGWSSVASGTEATLRNVAWNGTRFVAVGEQGTLLTSETGLSWTPVDSGTQADLIRIWADPTFWLAIGEGGTILYSPDGLEWQTANSGTDAALISIDHGGGRFMIVGEGGILLESLDGISWQGVDPEGLPEGTYRSLIYGRDEWAMIGPGSVIFTSATGEHWEARTLPGEANLEALILWEDRYIASGPGHFLGSAEAWSPELYPLDFGHWNLLDGEEVEFQLKSNDPEALFYAYNLPAGLSLDSGTGIVSGKIETFQSGTVAFGAISGNRTSPLRKVPFSVRPAAGEPPAITSPKGAVARVGEAFTYPITYDGPSWDANFSVEGLPAGLSGYTQPWRIAGVPAESGLFPVILTVENLYGTDQRTIWLFVSDPGERVPSWEIGEALRGVVSIDFDFLPTLNGSPAFFHAYGLPPGVEIDAATGRLTGAPATAGSYAAVLVAENEFGAAGKLLEIIVDFLEPRALADVSEMIRSSGQTVSIAAELWGSELNFQWLRDGVSLDGDERFGGVNSLELLLNGVIAPDTGVYRLRAWNTQGEVISGPIELTVTETYEAWAARELGGLSGDPAADGFIPGVPNLLAFALGLREGDRSGLPRVVSEPDGSISLRFGRSRMVEGTTVWIEVAAFLDDWEVHPNAGAEVERTPARTIRHYAWPTNEPRGFFRVRAEKGD